MSSILLTGGTGFIGNHLRSALGQPAILLGRAKPELLPNERWHYLDMSEPVVPETLAQGLKLCHLAYSMHAGRENVAYNRHLLDAVNACPQIKRVILMSSVSVYGMNGMPVVDEQSACDPVGEYAETKLECEMVWWEGLRSDCELTLLRPTEVIGIGGRGLLPLIQDALERPLVGMVKRSILYHRPLHYVAVRNVVAAVLFCLHSSQAPMREMFIVSDDHRSENKGYAVMQDLVRKLSGRRPLPGLAVPRPVLRSLGKITGRPLGLEQVFDSQKIRTAGFVDAVALEDEVRLLVREA